MNAQENAKEQIRIGELAWNMSGRIGDRNDWVDATFYVMKPDDIYYSESVTLYKSRGVDFSIIDSIYNK